MAASTWRMPAEWAPHEGTWLGWPHEKSDWPGKFAPIPFVYGKIIAKLTRFERVHLLCPDARAKAANREKAAQADALARGLSRVAEWSAAEIAEEQDA